MGEPKDTMTDALADIFKLWRAGRAGGGDAHFGFLLWGAERALWRDRQGSYALPSPTGSHAARRCLRLPSAASVFLILLSRPNL